MTSQPWRPRSTLILILQIALNHLAVENRGDSLSAVEGAVEREVQVRDITQLHGAREAAFEKRRATPQRRNDVGGVGASERHHERGCTAQIGADLYLGY